MAALRAGLARHALGAFAWTADASLDAAANSTAGGDTKDKVIDMVQTYLPIVSMLGSFFIVGVYALMVCSRRMNTASDVAKLVWVRPVVFLALADIGSAIGDLLAPLDLYPVACQIQGTMITYFDLASALWVLNITLQLEFLLVRAGATAPNPESYEKIYHAVGWLPPIAAAVLPYIVAGGYSANNGHCWLSVEAQASYPWLPYTIFYGPLWLIFVMVVVIFVRVRRHLRADVRDAAARKHILTKLMAYPAIFLVIWSFSTADKVVHDVTGSSPEWLQITHIVFSSLQGLFNALHYKGSPRYARPVKASKLSAMSGEPLIGGLTSGTATRPGPETTLGQAAATGGSAPRATDRYSKPTPHFHFLEPKKASSARRATGTGGLSVGGDDSGQLSAVASEAPASASHGSVDASAPAVADTPAHPPTIKLGHTQPVPAARGSFLVGGTLSGSVARRSGASLRGRATASRSSMKRGGAAGAGAGTAEGGAASAQSMVGLRLKTTARRQLEPKVMVAHAAHMQERGATPRKMAVERRRRQYEQYDIAAMLRANGVDYSVPGEGGDIRVTVGDIVVDGVAIPSSTPRPAATSFSVGGGGAAGAARADTPQAARVRIASQTDDLPLEAFDDSSSDIHSNEQWGELIAVARDAFEAIALDASGQPTGATLSTEEAAKAAAAAVTRGPGGKASGMKVVSGDDASPMDDSVLRLATPTPTPPSTPGGSGGASASATAAAVEAASSAMLEGQLRATALRRVRAPKPPTAGSGDSDDSDGEGAGSGGSGSRLRQGVWQRCAVVGYQKATSNASTVTGDVADDNDTFLVRWIETRQAPSARRGRGLMASPRDPTLSATEAAAKDGAAGGSDDAAPAGPTHHLLPGPPTAVPRIDICFDKEDPAAFAARVVSAHRARAEARATLRYNLAIDCMPLEDVGTPNAEQIRRITSSCISASRLLRASVDPGPLLREVTLDWQRTMNRLLFDKLRTTRGQAGIFRDVALPPARERKPAPQHALVQSSGPSFAGLKHAFCFKTTLTQPSVVQLLMVVKQECAKVANARLLSTSFGKSYTLAEFVSDQSKWTAQASGSLVNEWTMRVSGAVRHGLRDVGKGWYDLEETDVEVFKFSKLYRLLVMIRLFMQDTLRILTTDSVEAFTRTVLDRASAVVTVDDANTVNVVVPEETAYLEAAGLTPLVAALGGGAARKRDEGEEHMSAHELAVRLERREREQRLRVLLRPPPMFEVDLAVTKEKTVLNRATVVKARLARRAWRKRHGKGGGQRGGGDTASETEGGTPRSSQLNVDTGGGAAVAAGGEGKGDEYGDGESSSLYAQSPRAANAGAGFEGGDDELVYTSDESDEDSDSDEEDPKPLMIEPEFGYSFEFDRSGGMFRDAVVDAFDNALTSVRDIKEVSHRVMTKLFYSTKPPIASVGAHEASIRRQRRALSNAVVRACEPLAPYLASFDKYVALLNLDVEAELEKWSDQFGADMNINSVTAAVRKHEAMEKHLRDVLPVRVNLGMFTVRTGGVRELLCKRHAEMRKGLMDKLARWANRLTQTAREKTERAKRQMRKQVTNIEQLTDMRNFTEEVTEQLPLLRAQNNKALACKAALEEFHYKMDAIDMDQMWNGMRATEGLVSQLYGVQAALSRRQEDMYEEMTLQQGSFREELARLHREVFEFNNLYDLDKLENNHRRVMAVEKKVQEAEASAKLFNSREQLLDEQATEYKELKDIRKLFEPFNLLWTTAARWTTLHAKWKKTALMQLDAAEVEDEADKARTTIAQCCRMFYRMGNDGCLKAAQAIRDDTDQFAPCVPLIVGLLNPGMRDRHWKELNDVAGDSMILAANAGAGDKKPAAGSAVLSPTMTGTVYDLMEGGLADHITEVVKVAGIAGREHQLEVSLDTMEKAWTDHELDVPPYKDTGTFVLRGIAEMVALLDEHISMTQAMQFSSYKAAFEERIERWNKKLALVSEVLDEWILVQKTWLYLAPIFESDDINDQLPTEGKRFATVDTNWRRTLAGARAASDTMGFLASEKLLQKFRESTRFLNTVQKGLSDYLEGKRGVFPRFFFLSDDDLLAILSQTREVERVQDHLPKCFEGINTVEFERKNVKGGGRKDNMSKKASKRAAKRARFAAGGGDPTRLVKGREGHPLRSHEVFIGAMCSKEGERVPYGSPVEPADKGVEYWMTEVEEQMRAGVKDITVESLTEYPATKRTTWMQEWPGMVVLSVAGLMWTRQMEEALKKDRRSLNFAYEGMLAQLEDMVKLVRGKLSPMARLTIGSLTVIDVHQRDVTKKLLDLGVRSASAFEWVSQMRYYHRDDDIFVEMVTAVRPYGYEYLGNSFRLVITPLTDKCYMTCMSALQMTLGGAPEGPAGTGKTETTKDLAKALAKQCVVFNCSEGLDFLAMGKFFKGLAACGAWSCFDEFNRIDIEVLSVVAQQVVTLQTAARTGLKTIMFEGTELHMNDQFSVFITMNPGYAGRTELPGNLKALFRPVAMMVPDYALIGEIMLFAYGFSQARSLAQKMVSTFRLCSEQLSSQSHYDYGMRAVKSVITAAGNLWQQEAANAGSSSAAIRAAMSPENEHVVLLRALKDVNVPKFLTEDLVLFNGIISDLFPGVEPPVIDYGDLMTALRMAATNDTSAEGSSPTGLHLQPTKHFLGKCLQLYETTAVRHGMMLVGPTGGGKSATIKTLAAALSLVREIRGPTLGPFQKVRVATLNPKAITLGQLYGEFDDTTREWRDGILAKHIRTFATMNNRDHKWVVCDGPVDADWIENMNTVLDDNKKLCLTSGQIIQLSSEMRIMFEVEDLSQASPATVSRCGMIYMEPDALGLDPQITSWLDAMPPIVAATGRHQFMRLIDTYLGPALAFVRHHCVEPIPTNDSNLCASLLRLIDTFCDPFRHIDPDLGPAEGAVDQFEEQCEAYFVFSLVWSVGASLDELSRKKFDVWLRSEMRSNNSNFRIPHMAKSGPTTVYDYCFWYDDSSKPSKWELWMDAFPPDPYKHDKTTNFNELFVPTPDSIRMTHVMGQLLQCKHNVLLTGPTGTAKTVNVMRYLQNDVGRETIPLMFAFSARTTARQTQDFVDEKCEKRRRHVYGPPAGSTFIMFVDDLNMPARETYLAQPPLELLRQWLTYGGWYDMKSLEFWQIIDTVLVAAMGIPGGGRNPISARLPRRFNIIGVEPLEDASNVLIFGTLLTAFLTAAPGGEGSSKGTFEDSVKGLADGLVSASLEVYNTVLRELLPTPAKSHYTFNLRDLAKIFQGLLMCDPLDIIQPKQMLRLWVHECCRVVQDRLIDDIDRSWFEGLLREAMSLHLPMEWAEVMQPDPGLALAYANAALTAGDDDGDGDGDDGEDSGDDDDGLAKGTRLAIKAGMLDHAGLTRPRSLLFGEFPGMVSPTATAGGNASSKRIYFEIEDAPSLVPLFDEFLQDYNLESKTPMKLVMFMDAVHHVSRIARVLRQPQGNALLLGVGGSGRQSLTRLAAFIAEYRLVQINLTKSYSTDDWRDDVKKCLMRCGLEDKPTVFLISDTQITGDGMLEDINNLLNSGDVPGLYTADETDEIMEACRFQVSVQGLALTRLNLFAQYLSRVRQNLHVVVAMSPMGKEFRDRLRMFPSLVNCSTIDFFATWPSEALQWVAMSELGLSNADEDAAVEGAAAAALAEADAVAGKKGGGKDKPPQEDDGRGVPAILQGHPPERLDVLVKAFIEAHEVAAEAAERFYTSLRRRTYVTPTSYLELMRTYRLLSHRQLNKLRGRRGRLEGGLNKLADTNRQVINMQESLVNLRPELEQTQVQVDSMMVEIQADKVSADATKELVEKEEAEAQAMAEATRAIADDAQRDLDAVLPLLDAAVACLNKLKKADIDEVRSMTRPPNGVRLTMEACCILFAVKPVRKNNAMGEKVEDYWEAAQRNLLTEAKAFLARMMTFDKDNIPDKIITTLRPYIENPEFTPENVVRVNKASEGVCMWVRAMFKYHEVTLAVEPKKEALAKAQAELDATLLTLADAKGRLQAVMDRIAELEERYAQAVHRKESLAHEIQLCIKRLDAAQKLTTGLAGESVRWTDDVERLKRDEQLLLGDMLVSAAAITYAGPLTADFRVAMEAQWKKTLRKFKLPFHDGVSLMTSLSDPIRVREWQLASLPDDDLSSENGIIIEQGRRSPLMIDPQGQANRFVKSMGAKLDGGIEIVKPNDKHLMRTLENAVRFGRWVLLEGVGQVLDPSLGSVLDGPSAAASGMGGARGGQFMRIGDAMVPYLSTFKFFMTTKLPNPHYPPEVCTKVSLLNFTITQSGLEAQMLSDVIHRELPSLAERKAGLLVDNQRMQSELMGIEEKILFLLSNSKGNILDDSDLLDALERARSTAGEIAEKMKESAATEVEIDRSREAFRPIAVRASVLFFCIADLSGVDPMYQYSLPWFKNLFGTAVINTPPNDDVSTRVETLSDTFTALLYKVVCRSLFERHKLLFSFLLAVKISESQGLVNGTEWRFLISGATPSSLSEEMYPNPDSSAIAVSHRGWVEVLSLATLPPFAGLAGDLWKNFERWKEWMDTPSPESAPLPSTSGPGNGAHPVNWQERLTGMRRLCVLRALRPDRVVNAIRMFITERLGPQYITPPAFNITESFEASSNTTPLVFVLSPGADPLTELTQFASSTGMARNFRSISLGQGQGAQAEAMVVDGAVKGRWILLMNCHLFTSWMPALETIVESLDEETAHRDFRLWLTSEPSTAFPVSVLQESVKMTQERPKGLRANLRASFQRMKKSDLEMDTMSIERVHNKLLYGLCFFHACVTERVMYGPLGWNIPYGFTDGDLDISRQQLALFLPKYDKVPYRVLHELTANINYGGRVTDDKDLRTIDVILKTFFTSQILSDEYTFSPSGRYKSLPVNSEHPLETYLEDIETLPLDTEPEVMGMHANASITVALDDTYSLFDVVLALQPRDAPSASPAAGGGGDDGGDAASDDGRDRSSTASGSLSRRASAEDAADAAPSIAVSAPLSPPVSQPAKGKRKQSVARVKNTREDRIAETAASILEALPQPFDEADVRSMYALQYNESMNMVLVQEIVRFNRLLQVMHRTLRDVGLALEGLVVMSEELEDMASALFNQWVPTLWANAAYPSLKPLPAWVAELHTRVAFMQRWVDKGAPAAFWVSGFFFPQAFLTGTLQNYARKYSIPIDTISFGFEVHDDAPADDSYAAVEAPEDGAMIYGLFLEGARWDKIGRTLTDPQPKVLYEPLPLLHMLPVQDREPPARGFYRCPVYKTLARRGVLSTTGHSTNFVTWIELPAGRPTSTRLALVSETGVGERVSDCEDWIRAGVACVCSLRY